MLICNQLNSNQKSKTQNQECLRKKTIANLITIALKPKHAIWAFAMIFANCRVFVRPMQFVM